MVAIYLHKNRSSSVIYNHHLDNRITSQIWLVEKNYSLLLSVVGRIISLPVQLADGSVLIQLQQLHAVKFRPSVPLNQRWDSNKR